MPPSPHKLSVSTRTPAGLRYLKDFFNGADFVIILISVVMTLIALSTDLLEEGSAGISLLPLFKVVRLLRVVLVMTRMQRSRERLWRMKMVGLAAPVEKVFEIISELRRKVTHQEDDKALAWTMDLIAKEELYKVNFSDSKHSSGMHLTAEMTDWLRSNLQASLPGGLIGRNTGQDGDAGHSRGRQGSVAGAQSSKGAKAEDEKSVATKRRTSRFVSAAIPTWIQKSINETSVAAVLDKMNDWEFDVFALHEVTNGHPLVVGGIHLMMSMGVLDKIPIPKDKLATYLLNIERGYVPTNPFHNAVHASDVMFTTNYFLQAPLLRDMTGSLDKFAAVLAAAVHDYAHPGLSNPFLIATRAETAVLYNDQSVLEMFHIAVRAWPWPCTWRVLRAQPERVLRGPHPPFPARKPRRYRLFKDEPSAGLVPRDAHDAWLRYHRRHDARAVPPISRDYGVHGARDRFEGALRALRPP